jgi:TetR/AcrR family transcriptional regulator
MKESGLSEQPHRRGRKRVYDAGKTRTAILSAAEKSFAAHGYNGVSVDAIARIAGCNKSLLFQYFENKMGLYSAVLADADDRLAVLVERCGAPAEGNAPVVGGRAGFRSFLRSMFGAFFDYMAENPNFARILAWEQSDGWKTFGSIASRFEPRDLPKLDELFSSARAAGYLRADIDSVVLIVIVLQACWATVVSLPFYGLLLPGKDEPQLVSSVRKQLVEFLVNGAMNSETEESVEE